MSTTAAPEPIPGDHIDPDLKSQESTARKLEDRHAAAGVGFRAFLRFSHANVLLLAAGTTYYLFLSAFALIALGFGVAALLGSEEIQQAINDALNTVFPGLLGEEELDPERLESIGRSSSLAGLVLLLYSGSGAIGAAHSSLHLINGAPKDGRNFVLGKVRLIGLLLVVAPLILVSFAPSLVVTNFAEPVLEAVGLDNALGRTLLVGLSVAVSFVLDVVIIYLLLSTLGGIRPARRARVIGAVLGAIGIEIIKFLLGAIVAWSVSKPEYGAFAAPITILFVFYLLTLVLYGAACVTAGIAEVSGSSAPLAEPDSTA